MAVKLSPALRDDSVFVPHSDTPTSPQILAQLLARLRVYDSNRAEQDAAVTAWLRVNEPPPNLRFSIIDEGRGYLLNKARTA